MAAHSLICRRKFLEKMGATAIAGVIPTIRNSKAADQVFRNNDNAHILPIVTSRAILSEPGYSGIEVGERLTQQPYNFIYNEVGFSNRERFVSTSPFKQYFRTVDTVNLFFHGSATGFDNAIDFGAEFFQSLNPSERDKQLDILVNIRSDTIEHGINPSLLFGFNTMWRIAKELPKAYLGQYNTDSRITQVDAKKIGFFLYDLSKNFRGNINIIAHSLGARNALCAIHDFVEVSLEREGKSPSENAINQLVLFSPDVSYGEFDDKGNKVLSVTGRTTIYTSPEDLALYVAGIISDANKHPDRLRIGVPEPSIDRLYSIDAIDYLFYRSRISIVNHSFFLKEPRIMFDVQYLLNIKRGESSAMLERTIAKTLKRIDGKLNAFEMR